MAADANHDEAPDTLYKETLWGVPVAIVDVSEGFILTNTKTSSAGKTCTADHFSYTVFAMVFHFKTNRGPHLWSHSSTAVPFDHCRASVGICL